jgi:cell division septation protein DedD
MAKPSRELQFSTHQMIGVFLGILALGIFVFLLGVSIGKKQTLLAAAGGAASGPKTETAAPKVPITGEAAPGDIQKELDAHARSTIPAASPAKTEPSPAPLESPTGKPAGKPADKPADKPAVKTAADAPDKTTAKPEPGLKKPAPAETAGGWFVQVAAVADRPSASAFADKLQKDGYPAILVEPSAKDKKSIFRVRVGPFGTKGEADEAKNKLTEAMKKKKSDYFLVKG